MPHIKVQTEDFDIGAEIAALTAGHTDIGGIGCFVGTVRADTKGSTVTGMTQPTGWHYPVCEGQFVYALKGWVELEFEDGTDCRLEAGDSCFIPGGMHHNEIRTSDDLEIAQLPRRFRLAEQQKAAVAQRIAE